MMEKKKRPPVEIEIKKLKESMESADCLVKFWLVFSLGLSMIFGFLLSKKANDDDCSQRDRDKGYMIDSVRQDLNQLRSDAPGQMLQSEIYALYERLGLQYTELCGPPRAIPKITIKEPGCK